MTNPPAELVIFNPDGSISCTKFGHRTPKGAVVVGTIDTKGHCWIVDAADCDRYGAERLVDFQNVFSTGLVLRESYGEGPDPKTIFKQQLGINQWQLEQMDDHVTNFGWYLDIAHRNVVNYVFEQYRSDISRMNFRWVASEMSIRPYAKFYAPLAVVCFVAAAAQQLLECDLRFINGEGAELELAAHTICDQLRTNSVFTSRTMRTLLCAMHAANDVSADAVVALMQHLAVPAA